MGMGSTEQVGRKVDNKYSLDSAAQEHFIFKCSQDFKFIGSFGLKHLQEKLERNGFENISFLVVNHQGNSSRERYKHLRSSVSETIPVYQQDVNQPDVWELLEGNKDDFLIYDSCGKLTFHLELPYTILTYPYVEYAIMKTSCESICANCSLQPPNPACAARNITEELKQRREPHHSRWQHNHNRKASGDLAGDQDNGTEHTQSMEGAHMHRQNHHHPHHRHQADAAVDSVAPQHSP
ncbi:hypothetical protein scyTo_0011507 [Scyliorhinus torazame]|uniref:Selenoprotein P N-terminal domain-containing protein n=1 Tax=Scyliorhinus torazame TaxID=75743 RepID=A0A401NPE6_SCYTO|nr:hypothetical protein [Scyliorhinus torazame]